MKPEEVDLGFNKDAEKPKCDPSKPSGNIQIRFHNGQRTVIQVNEDLPVSELYNYVTMAAPVASNFELITGFPPVPVSDLSATVGASGLINSSVTQRLS